MKTRAPLQRPFAAWLRPPPEPQTFIRMKTILIAIAFLFVVALSLRLGYSTGLADGWQLAQNEVQTATEFRDRLIAEKGPQTAETVTAAWAVAAGNARARHAEWRARGFITRSERPAPAWYGAAAPVAWVPPKKPTARQLSIFPLSEMGRATP